MAVLLPAALCICLSKNNISVITAWMMVDIGEGNAEGQQEDNHSNKTHNLQKSEEYYKDKQKLVGIRSE